MVPTSRKGRGVKKLSHIGVRVGDDVVEALRPAMLAGAETNRCFYAGGTGRSKQRIYYRLAGSGFLADHGPMQPK